MTLSASIGPNPTNININEFNKDKSDNLSNNRIDNKIKNLSNITKVKKSFGTDFFTFRAKKVFIYL